MAYMVYTLYELINRNAFKLYFRDKKIFKWKVGVEVLLQFA